MAVDVHVLAATNRDLPAAVAAGTFRQDLFYRLNVFPIQMPSLRERVDDIPLLVAYLIERYATKAGKKIRTITKQTLALFQAYDWPGNIRELQNVIERAVILCASDTFAVEETTGMRSKPPWPNAAAGCPAPPAQRPSWVCRGRRSNRKSKPWAFPSSASKRDRGTAAPGTGHTALSGRSRRVLSVHAG